MSDISDESRNSVVGQVVKVLSSPPMFLILLGFLACIFAAIDKIPIGTQSIQLTNAYSRIGIAILGAVFLGIGIRILWRDTTHKNSPGPMMKTKVEQIALNSERTLVTGDYFELAEKAKEIEIAALSLKTFREFFGREKIVQLLKEGKKFKILILFPNAYVTQIRQMEEEKFHSVSFRVDIEHSLRTFGKLYERCKDLEGSIEVRLYDTIPHFAYFRADNVLILGFYYHHKSGLKSECLRIEETTGNVPGGISSNLRQHFKTLWDENKNNTFCIVGQHGIPPNREILNNATILKSKLK